MPLPRWWHPSPLRPLGGISACCFCGARVREAELVRPIWGPRPCPQGHRHHPLEVVARCRACSQEERGRLEALARGVAAMREELEREAQPSPAQAPGGPGPGRRPGRGPAQAAKAAARQASLF